MAGWKRCNPSLISPNGTQVNLSDTERLRSPAGQLDTMGLALFFKPFLVTFVPAFYTGRRSERLKSQRLGKRFARQPES